VQVVAGDEVAVDLASSDAWVKESSGVGIERKSM
jgi:hypothetical protein